MPTFTDGQAVLVEDGLRFDLVKTLDAMEALIDLCAKAGAPIVRTVHAEHDLRVPWDTHGKRAFRDTCIKIGTIYETIYEPLVAVFDGFCLKLFPFGMTWCVYEEANDMLVTPAGKPISELDPTPGILIYGAERGLNLFDLATPGIVEVVRRIVEEPLIGYGMCFVKGEPLHTSTDMTMLGQFARIEFPHAVFGAGRGPIRVRCERKP